jgi:hypothetical protein
MVGKGYWKRLFNMFRRKSKYSAPLDRRSPAIPPHILIENTAIRVKRLKMFGFSFIFRLSHRQKTWTR